MTTVVKTAAQPILITTAMYDLLKEELRRKRLSPYNEAKLMLELKAAKQALNREIPENVVTVNKLVRVRDVQTGEETTYQLVAPDKARRKHNTHSILSPIGVAMLGYAEGSEVSWEMKNGVRTYEIIEVTRLPIR